MITWRRCAITVGLAVTLAACSSTDEFGGQDGTAPRIQAIADKAGCTLTPIPDKAIHVAERGLCDDTKLFTFSTTKNRDNWLKVAQSFGGLYLVGDQWTATGERAMLEKLKGDLGGEIRG